MKPCSTHWKVASSPLPSSHNCPLRRHYINKALLSPLAPLIKAALILSLLSVILRATRTDTALGAWNTVVHTHTKRRIRHIILGAHLISSVRNRWPAFILEISAGQQRQSQAHHGKQAQSLSNKQHLNPLKQHLPDIPQAKMVFHPTSTLFPPNIPP